MSHLCTSLFIWCQIEAAKTYLYITIHSNANIKGIYELLFKMWKKIGFLEKMYFLENFDRHYIFTIGLDKGNVP